MLSRMVIAAATPNFTKIKVGTLFFYFTEPFSNFRGWRRWRDGLTIDYIFKDYAIIFTMQ
jgi:hypothetical protein